MMCNSFFECSIALLLNQIILFVIGVLTLVVGLTSKVSLIGLHPSLEGISTLIKISEKLGLILRPAGWIIIVISSIWALVVYGNSPLSVIQVPITITPTPISTSTFATATSSSVPSQAVTESERTIESFPIKIFDYDGVGDSQVKQGWAKLAIAFSDQKTSYLFDYNLPSDGTYGYAGLVFRFDQSQDLSSYQTIRVVLDYLDDTSLCELYINDISSQGDFYQLGKTNLPGGILKIDGTEYSYDIALSNFVKPNFKAIYEVGLSVDTDITKGGHRIVLKKITFVR